LVIGHWSLVIGHWSLVIGHWSLVIGHWARGYIWLNYEPFAVYSPPTPLLSTHYSVLGTKNCTAPIPL